MQAARTTLRLESKPTQEYSGIDRVLEFHQSTGELWINYLKAPLPDGRSVTLADVVQSVADEQFAARMKNSQPDLIRNNFVPGAYSAPLKLFVDVNMKCQIRCEFCLSDVRDGVEDELPMQTIKDIAHEARRLGVFYVKVGGGEPTLYSRLDEMLAELYGAGLYITMSTNALGITANKAEILKRYNVGVSVSLSGLEETSNRLMKHQHHFKMALTTIGELKQLGVNVRIRVTLLKENLDEVPQLVDLAKSKGVKIKFGYCRPAGKAIQSRSSMLGPEDAPRYLSALAYLNRVDVLPYVILDEGMTFDQPAEIKQRQGNDNACGAARRSFHINAFGTVSPCVFLGDEYDGGKFLGSGDLDRFWSGAKGAAFAKARSIDAPSPCSQCSRSCKNECPATRLYHWNDLAQQDPNCVRQALRNAGIRASFEEWRSTL